MVDFERLLKQEQVNKMAIGKKTINKPNEQNDEFETVAILKSMNVYDKTTGQYTEEINQKTVKVETFVKNLKEEKPQTIGYISVSTLGRFLYGEVKAVPIKMRKN